MISNVRQVIQGTSLSAFQQQHSDRMLLKHVTEIQQKKICLQSLTDAECLCFPQSLMDQLLCRRYTAIKHVLSSCLFNKDCFSLFVVVLNLSSFFSAQPIEY